jgi:hypothetical protein
MATAVTSPAIATFNKRMSPDNGARAKVATGETDFWGAHRAIGGNARGKKLAGVKPAPPRMSSASVFRDGARVGRGA